MLQDAGNWGPQIPQRLGHILSDATPGVLMVILVSGCIILYSIGYLRSWHHFLFLDNIEKIQEKIKLSFEYFCKYYGKLEHLLQ